MTLIQAPKSKEVIRDGNGKGVSGYDAADRFGVEPPPIGASTANIRYVLGTTVPENWIPFLPVHQAGSNESIQFRRAAMPKLGVPPTEVVRPQGLLLTEVRKRSNDSCSERTIQIISALVWPQPNCARRKGLKMNLNFTSSLQGNFEHAASADFKIRVNATTI